MRSVASKLGGLVPTAAQFFFSAKSWKSTSRIARVPLFKTLKNSASPMNLRLEPSHRSILVKFGYEPCALRQLRDLEDATLPQHFTPFTTEPTEDTPSRHTARECGGSIK